MEPSPLNPKTSCHARSISLPSRSHPFTLSVKEQLYRLRSLEADTSSSSICHNLSGLIELYNRVDDLLQLPLIQQALTRERSNECVNEVLDGYLRLLDVYGTTRDVLLQVKECVQDLQSSLRRQRRGDLCLSNEVGIYIICRKKVNKVIQKSLGDIKRMENKYVFSSLLEKDHNVVAVIGVVREVEAITLCMLESLLSFISAPRSRSKPSGWSLVSKLMPTRHVAWQGEEAGICEMEKVDVALSTLTAHKSCKAIEVQNVQKQLESLELSIRGLEEGLECVFRSLSKTRVSFLNILSH